MQGTAFNAAFPTLLGEPVFVLWLVIIGARPKVPVPSASAAPA